MKYAGVDLHKQTISVCVVNQARQVLTHCRLACSNPQSVRMFFEPLGEFQAVVEATASYEWFVQLLEPLAERVVLAHPKKLRVIAESTRKSDRLDAKTLAEFLALDMIPRSYRPTPRQRDHRRLVRHRAQTVRRASATRVQLRRLLADYNADQEGLFTCRGFKHLQEVKLSPADRFAVDQLLARWQFLVAQRKAVENELRRFAESAPVAEREARALLRTIPGIGLITSEVILAELADIGRFCSQKRVVAYAGLAPGQRESAGKRRELHLEKCGSRLLRHAMVEAAWRLVRLSPRWRYTYHRLKVRLRAKKAIVAIARRLLCIVTAVLKSGQAYRHTATQKT